MIQNCSQYLSKTAANLPKTAVNPTIRTLQQFIFVASV